MVQVVKRACALLSYQLAPLGTVVQLVLGTWYNPPPPLKEYFKILNRCFEETLHCCVSSYSYVTL